MYGFKDSLAKRVSTVNARVQCDQFHQFFNQFFFSNFITGTPSSMRDIGRDLCVSVVI